MNALKNSLSFPLNFKNNIAIVWKNKKYSYNDILEKVLFWQNKLSDIKQGAVVAIEGDFSPEAIAILICLIDINAIIVPLDLKQQSKNTKKFEIAQTDIRITIDENEQVAIVNDNNDAEIPENKLYNRIRERKSPGLVLFTSGSSGEPKAAVHDFSKLLKKFKLSRKAHITINFLLFDHWGGLNTYSTYFQMEELLLHCKKEVPIIFAN